jgi:hypothetical protein
MKSSESSLFDTGISERTHTNRTLVSLISGLRQQLPAEVVTVRESEVMRSSFNDVITQDQRIYLKGQEVRGRSLNQIIKDFSTERFISEKTKALLRTVVKLIDAAKEYRDHTGGFPKLLLNGIYIVGDGSEVTFLPYPLMDYLNTFHNETLRRALYLPLYLSGRAKRSRPVSATEPEGTGVGTSFMREDEFVRALGSLLYLCFSSQGEETTAQETTDHPVLYLKSLLKDAPALLSDTLWNILHGRTVSEDRLREILTSSLHDESPGVGSVPLMKRNTVVFYKNRLHSFFTRRWKLLLLLVMLIGAGGYLLSDALSSRNRVDYTAGLSPQQVVELYYRAMNDLDLDVIDAVFYKRAGKKIRDELSTLYVMLKMETAFGKILVHPEDIGVQGYQPERHSVFGILDLDLQQRGDEDHPRFDARYRRVISSDDELYQYAVEETIYLEYIHDHWYITKSDRTIENSSKIQEIP